MDKITTFSKFNVERSFEQMKERGWERLYWFIDFHDTIAVADYGDLTKREFFPKAKEVLQFLTNKPEICLVLWTCSHRDDIDDMIKWLKKHDITFEYINENPECQTTKRMNVESKPYYNVLLDDRSGFNPTSDWYFLRTILSRIYNVEI